MAGPAEASPGILFLPGAGGDGRFWQPVADRLPADWPKVLLDWPGLGHVPPDSGVGALDDLVRLVLVRADRPVDLVAQSMGGLVALLAVLRRPDRVRRLVLTATSGGLDLARFSVQDWRPEYVREFPGAAPWILTARADLSDQLPAVQCPTLLLWGDADPISPPAVGEHLVKILPSARLVVIAGGDHAFARDRADEVAPPVLRHLTGS
jgi:pimeloyl-ACP methyl ester carboxylesterase